MQNSWGKGRGRALATIVCIPGGPFKERAALEVMEATTLVAVLQAGTGHGEGTTPAGDGTLEEMYDRMSIAMMAWRFEKNTVAKMQESMDGAPLGPSTYPR